MCCYAYSANHLRVESTKPAIFVSKLDDPFVMICVATYAMISCGWSKCDPGPLVSPSVGWVGSLYSEAMIVFVLVIIAYVRRLVSGFVRKFVGVCGVWPCI